MTKKLIELGDSSQKFKFVKGMIEELTEKDVPLVDIIVSEWMGYFLLFENMVSSYIFSIKNFLKPGGIMIPSQAFMYLDAASYDTKKVAKKYV